MNIKPKVTQYRSRARSWHITALLLLGLFLAACSSDVQEAPGTELTPSAESMSTWKSRLISTIENPNYSGYSDWLNPVMLSETGNTYTYGRNFNNYMTGLITAYNETGDKRIAEHMNSLMNRMKGKLRDYNGDGYKNWRYLNKDADRSSRGYYGGDYHVMDDILTHSMVAAAAYTLKRAGYSSSASFWTDYLKNDFEAKWRKRNKRPSGFPFVWKDLMHPYAQFIRYHYYMAKLTGSSSYYSEAKRMAGVVKSHMRSTSTPSGTGYVWDHHVEIKGGRPDLNGCQPTTYLRTTIQAMAELSVQDSSLFDSSFMRKVANSMAHRVLKRTDGTAMASSICGGGSFGNLYYFAYFPYSYAGPWDSSGRIETATVRAYNAVERRRTSNPRSPNLPASMVFILGN